MKTKDFKDLKIKEIKELTSLLNDKILQSLKIKAKISSGKEKDVKVFRNLRRDIARISTLITEKEIMAKHKSIEK